MSCPTCDHTMESFAGGGPEDERARYLCPRCGTVVVTEPGEADEIYVPKLVERCRMFAAELLLRGIWVQQDLLALLSGHGIAECINPPGRRLP